MKSFRYVGSSVVCALALISSYAFGAPTFPKAIEVLHIDDGGVYSTNWTVYPIRVERIDMNTRKPEEMTLSLFEDGKEGGFEGVVTIDCEQPVTSFVETGYNGLQQFSAVSLKDMMKNDVLPRKLVGNLFAVFCKGLSLNAADLDMSRD